MCFQTTNILSRPGSDAELFTSRTKYIELRISQERLSQFGSAKPFFLPNPVGNFDFGTALIQSVVETFTSRTKCIGYCK